MRAKSPVVSTMTLVVALVLAGCATGDGPASPTRAPVAPPRSASATLLSSPISVSPVLRNTALSAPVTVTKTIGVFGGAISVPGTGLTVIVPALAVSSNTQFSVTALAGSAIAYDFAPHRTFNVPLVMLQDLHDTQVESGVVNPLDLFVGYFPNTNDITSVTETLGVGVNVQALFATFTVSHFSGYILAGGRSDEE